MSILHTADLHLTDDNEERWAALDELIMIANQERVSALVICGDLFDHHSEAEKLRGRLRAAIGKSSFQTIILPGNHDHRSYRSGLYFGENVSVISSWEEPVYLEEAVIWGLPYEQISGEKLVSRLQEISRKMKPEHLNYLLFHGELLDAYFSREDMGNEGDKRYMPVKLSYFEALPLQHVLAGHFHSRFVSWKIPGGGLFTYPGSPVAVTRRETGARKANLVKAGHDPVEIKLNTDHYEEVVIDLDPFETEDPRKLLERELLHSHPRAKILLTVKGLFNGFTLGLTEDEMVSEIKGMAGERLADQPLFIFSDVRHLLEDDLFKKFLNRINKMDSSQQQKEEITELLITAFRAVKR